MSLMDRYRDVIEFPYPALDPMQFFIGKKGFMDWVKSLDEKELIEFAKQYVVWRDRRLQECALIRFSKLDERGTEKYEYRVYVPKLRALRRNYYEWIKAVELPRGRYRLVTLTLSRHVSIVEAWKNINRWTSRCLHRVRNRLRRRYKVDLFYIWVVEVHKDGYPHVHLLFMVDRFVKGLTFEVFLRILQESWVDDEGRPLCAPQGVDVKYIGFNIAKVKDYLLKYLVKDHGKIWGFEMVRMLVRVRLSTLLIWVFKVKLFFISQKIKRLEGERRACRYLGRVSVYRLWRFEYYPESFDVFLRRFLEQGRSRPIEEWKIPLLLGEYYLVSIQ